MRALSETARAYEPRRARASPLYRLVLDELESWAAGLRAAPGPAPEACAEDSLRAFLECGVHRFGAVRFLCGRCGASLFVPFSCKRRVSCPSCDAKRSAQGSMKALEELLPEVPYRQWVLVVPKRLRFFIHRDKRLPGELSGVLARVLNRYYARKSARGSIPAQFHVVQRFGSQVNLHVHVHAVVSEGGFSLSEGVLTFHPAPPPDLAELAALSREVRKKVLLRLHRLRAVPEEAIEELASRPLGGFSLDGSQRIEAQDRAGLGRLLGYVLRPAVSVKRLSYRPEEGVVKYWPRKRRDGEQKVVEFKPLEFLSRFARLIPPPRVHLIRHHGALGPRSPLRRAVTLAARDKANFQSLLEGISLLGTKGAALRAARAVVRVGSAALRGWAACLGHIFEVDVIKCAECGGEMKAVAVIMDEGELARLMKYLGVEEEYPRTRPARAPPEAFSGEESQVDPQVDRWEGVDEG